MQTHRDHFSRIAAFGRQLGFDLLQLLDFFRQPVFGGSADRVVAPNRGAEESETHRLPDHQTHFLRGQLGRRCWLELMHLADLGVGDPERARLFGLARHHGWIGQHVHPELARPHRVDRGARVERAVLRQ